MAVSRRLVPANRSTSASGDAARAATALSPRTPRQSTFDTRRRKSHVYPIVYPGSDNVGLMTSRQVPVRLPASVLVDLDALVTCGAYRSRTAAIRAGIEMIIAAEREREIDAAIVAGYRRCPPSPAEDRAAVAELRAAIEDEPW